MKILFVLTNDGFGGAEFYARDLARALIAAQHDVKIFIAGERRDLAQEMSEKGIPTVLSGTTFRISQIIKVLRNGYQLRRSVKAWKADIVLANLPRSVVLAAIFLPFARKVSILHGPLRKDAISRIAGILTRRYLANTPVTASEVQSTLGRAVPHHVILPTAVAEDSRPEARRDTITMIGRWQTYKGHDDFVSMAQSISTAFSDARFCIIGSVADESQRDHFNRVAARIKESGLSSRITVVTDAESQQIQDTLHRTRVYVHTAKSEDFGISIIEALLAGCSVASYQAVGPEMILQHSGAAALVPIGDVRAITAEVVRLWETAADPAQQAVARELGARFSFGERYIAECDEAVREMSR